MNRKTGLRRVPLEPGSPPARRTPLARNALPQAPRATQGAREPGAKPKSAATGRGNSRPAPEVRRLVLERDGYRCACGCRQSIIGQRYSLGHRLRASQGGKPVPSNLLTFLGWGGEACHGRIDSRRDPGDEANGMTVRSWQDPAMVPVQVACEDGSRVTKWLLDDGSYADEQPEEVAA